jgi:hypothetical protein
MGVDAHVALAGESFSRAGHGDVIAQGDTFEHAVD